jgi:hypothetical protein
MKGKQTPNPKLQCTKLSSNYTTNTPNSKTFHIPVQDNRMPKDTPYDGTVLRRMAPTSTAETQEQRMTPKASWFPMSLLPKLHMKEWGDLSLFFSVSTISHYTNLQQSNNAQRIHLGIPHQNTNRHCTICNKMDLTKTPSQGNSKTASTSLTWRKRLWSAF